MDTSGGKDYKVDILAEIDDAPPAYLHSFAMTEKYVILCVWQAIYEHYGASILVNRNLASSLKKWDARQDALFYVVDRQKGGVVGKFKVRLYIRLI